MKLIASADNNWAIGKDNKLLYHAPADMKFFKNTTTGGVVIMGRKTLESLPGAKPLPNRVNIIVTTNKNFTCEGAVICHSREAVLDAVKEYDTDKVFVMGGASIYSLFLPDCDTALITKFDAETPDADTYLENLDENSRWKLSETSPTEEHNGLRFRFYTYHRV